MVVKMLDFRLFESLKSALSRTSNSPKLSPGSWILHCFCENFPEYPPDILIQTFIEFHSTFHCLKITNYWFSNSFPVLLCHYFFCTHLILSLVAKISREVFKNCDLLEKFINIWHPSQDHHKTGERAGAAFWKQESSVQNGRVRTYEGGTVKDFYHSFCPILIHLKNATPLSPFPLRFSGER